MKSDLLPAVMAGSSFRHAVALPSAADPEMASRIGKMALPILVFLGGHQCQDFDAIIHGDDRAAFHYMNDLLDIWENFSGF